MSQLLIYAEDPISGLAGGSRWIIELSRRLAETYRWSVHVLTTTRGQHQERVAEANMRATISDVYSTALESRQSRLEYLWNMPKDIGRLKRSLEDAEIVYWLDGFPRPLSDGVIKAILHSQRIPFIQGLQQPIFIGCRGKPYTYLHNFFSSIRLLNPFDRTHYYHTPNSADYRILTRLGIPSIYAPNGVDTGLFIPGDRESNRFTVLTIGARWQKGTDFLPSIVNTTLGLAANLQFVLIAGPGSRPQYTSILHDVKRAHPDSVTVLGAVPYRDLCKYYANAHLLLFPSRYEGFGNVVVEALSCGTPVVAFDINGAPRDAIVDGSTGSLVQPYRLTSMAKSIVAYRNLWSNDHRRYQGFCSAARDRAMDFDWDKVAKQLHEKLRDVLYI